MHETTSSSIEHSSSTAVLLLSDPPPRNTQRAPCLSLKKEKKIGLGLLKINPKTGSAVNSRGEGEVKLRLDKVMKGLW